MELRLLHHLIPPDNLISQDNVKEDNTGDLSDQEELDIERGI